MRLTLSPTNTFYILALTFILVACPSNSESLPSAPSNLTVSSDDRKCTLNWNSSDGATSYTVYQSKSSPVDISGQGIEVILTNYQVMELQNDTTYYFVVIASNKVGESTTSNEVSCKPQGKPPVAPNNLVSDPGNQKCALSWNTVIGVSSYDVYQSTTSPVELF